MPSICYEANQGEPTSSAADQQHEEQGQHLIDFYVPQMQQDPSLSHGSSANQNSNAQHNGTSSTSDVTVAAEQMEAIRQLSAVVQKLSSAVDSNNVTMCRLENTVDKISVAVMSQRERVQRSNFSDANGNDDAVSELLDGDDSSRNVGHAYDGLDRKQVRLDGLEVYAVVSAVTAGTLVAVFDSYHPGDIIDLFYQGQYLEVLVSFIFLVTGCIGIICGLHCIFIFSLVTMYGRTALGMERDDALEIFFAGTGLQRYHGFKTFVGSLYAMMILLIVSITSKVSDRPIVHLAALALTARLMYYVYEDTQTIMEKAGVIFAPPSVLSNENEINGSGEAGMPTKGILVDEDDDSISLLDRLSRRPSMVSTTTEDSKRALPLGSATGGRRQSSLTVSAEELIKSRELEMSPSPPPIEEVPVIEISPSQEANPNRHKILKVLRALDPRGDNFHRGKERANRLAKFRSYVDGKYTDGVPPNFVDADITLLLLGTSDDGGDRHLPGLLRACGVPSKNHQGAGDHILLKKSAHDAIELLRYLVCDFGGVHEEQNPFERVFCSLPSSELRQIRLSLHIAGFGGKREGSKEDACQILTRYLLCTCSATNKMAGGDTSARASSILDDVLPAQDARIALRGWFAQQPKEIQLAAKRMSVKCLNPDGSSRSLLGSSTGNSGGGKRAARSTVMRQRGKSLPPKSIGRI